MAFNAIVITQHSGTDGKLARLGWVHIPEADERRSLYFIKMDAEQTWTTINMTAMVYACWAISWSLWLDSHDPGCDDVQMGMGVRCRDD